MSLGRRWWQAVSDRPNRTPAGWGSCDRPAVKLDENALSSACIRQVVVVGA